MKVVLVTPKSINRANGTAVTPKMTVKVITQMHTATPYYNGEKEFAEKPYAHIWIRLQEGMLQRKRL